MLVEMADRDARRRSIRRCPSSARAQLEELGVEVRTGVRVEAIDARGVQVGGETHRRRHRAVGRGRAAEPAGRGAGRAARPRAGGSSSAPDCAVPGHPELFVIGDMASFTPDGRAAPLPGISPVAMQQARSVARNILDDAAGVPREPFRYFDKGFMATIGRARAVAQLGRAAHVGADRRGWPGCSSTSGTWSASATGCRVFTNWIWAYVVSRHGARVITGRRTPAPTPPRVPSLASQRAGHRPAVQELADPRRGGREVSRHADRDWPFGPKD